MEGNRTRGEACAQGVSPHSGRGSEPFRLTCDRSRRTPCPHRGRHRRARRAPPTCSLETGLRPSGSRNRRKLLPGLRCCASLEPPGAPGGGQLHQSCLRAPRGLASSPRSFRASGCFYLEQTGSHNRCAWGWAEKPSKKTLLLQLQEIDGFHLLQDQTCFYLLRGQSPGERIETLG